LKACPNAPPGFTYEERNEGLAITLPMVSLLQQAVSGNKHELNIRPYQQSAAAAAATLIDRHRICLAVQHVPGEMDPSTV